MPLQFDAAGHPRMARPLNARRPAALLALAAGLLAAPLAQAQRDTPVEADRPSRVALQPGERRADTPVIEFIRFDGGNTSDYIALLRRVLTDEPLNIVATPEALDHPVQPLSLSRVTIDGALDTLELGDPHQRLRVSSHRPDGSAAIYSISLLPDRGQRGVNSPPAPVTMFSLSDLIDPLPGSRSDRSLILPLETVLSGIEAAVTVAADDRSAPAQLKYHEDSGLLILRGTGEQLSAADQAVSLMRRDIERRRAAIERAATATPPAGNDSAELRRADLAAALYTANLELRRRELETTAAEENLARARQLAETAMISERDVREAQLHLERARLDMQIARAEVERLDAQLRFLAGDKPDPDDARAANEAADLVRQRQVALDNARAELQAAQAREGVDIPAARIRELIAAVKEAEIQLRDAQVQFRLIREQSRLSGDAGALARERQRVVDLTREVDMAREAAHQLESHLVNTRADAAAQEARANMLESEIRALREELAATRAENAALQAAADRAARRIAELERDLSRPNPPRD
ncbi:MAG: hypothetical protein ACF8SC_07020 [Phycisphaerales bacterium JB037]